MTITSFPASPNQMKDLYTFLHGIYEEFRRLRLYNSTIISFHRRLSERGGRTEDTHRDHLFKNGPLPGDFTFDILERDIRARRVHRGHEVWLADVCHGDNMWSGWRIVLELT